MSSVVEFQKWWVLKSKIFGQKSTYLKEKIDVLKLKKKNLSIDFESTILALFDEP